MRFPAVLLRVLLSLCLVVNGTATAVASVRMAAMADQASNAESGASDRAHARAAMPCHDGDGTGIATTDHDHAPTKSVPAKSERPSHGCCGGTNCHCACSMQAPMALLPDLLRIPQHGGHERSFRSLSLAHPPPLRMPLMRPPIR